MKAELYMTSPEQEFSLRTVKEATASGAYGSSEQRLEDQWLRLWDRNWIRLWERNWMRWFRTWSRGWFRFWDRYLEPPWPWEVDHILEGEEPSEIKPIMQRLLLRREEFGFLAMDSLTSRVLKLDEQAGKLVQLVQDGMSPEDAAKKLGAKKKAMKEFIAFLELHDISAER